MGYYLLLIFLCSFYSIMLVVYESTSLGELFDYFEDRGDLVENSYPTHNLDSSSVLNPKVSTFKYDLYDGKAQAHDAGYDSWMTALVFASLMVRERIGIFP